MNFMKRAFLYVSRKRGKSILLFFILLILSTFVLTGLSIGSASKQAQKNLRQNIGGSFNIDVNYSDSNPYYHEEESENEDGSSDLLMYSTEQVTSKMVENIRNISGVKFCDATTESLINFDKLLPFAGTVPLDESLSHCVKSIGVWRSEEQNFFTSGKIQLIEGRHVPIILADEPTGNLDEITAAEITQILQETAHKLNKCVIIVTHSKDVAQKADAVLELKQGILRQVKK